MERDLPEMKENKDKKEKGLKRSGNKKRWIVIAAIVIVIVIAAFVVYNLSSSRSASAAREVTTVPLATADLQQVISASGNIESAQTLHIYAPSQLEIKSLEVKVGDKITAGQTLALLDTNTLENDIRTQELNIESAEASLRDTQKSNSKSSASSSASIASAKTELELATESYERQLAKVEAQSSALPDLPEEGASADGSGASTGTGAPMASGPADEGSASGVKTAKAELDAAQDKYDDLLSQSHETSSILTAQKELEMARDEYNKAYSGESTSNSVISAQMELSNAQVKLNDVIAQQENAVNTAWLDWQNSENTYYNTEWVTKDLEGNESENIAGREQARINIDKAKVAYDNALVNRNSNVSTAQQSVSSAQLNLDKALTGADDTLTAAYDKLDKAQITYDNAIKTADDNLKTAADNLEKTRVSYQNALDSQKDSVQSADDSLKKAQASYNSAKANAGTATGTASAEVNIEQQQLKLEQLQQDLQDATIRAPREGTVTYVSAIEGATANGLMFIVEDTEDLIIKAEVGEIDINRVSVGQKVNLEFENTGEEVFQGEVISISDSAVKAADGSITSGTNISFVVEIRVLDKDPRIKIGMNAELSIVVAERTGVLAVSTENLIREGNAAFVEVQTEEEIIRIPVELGIAGDNMTEVISPNLSAGMEIVEQLDRSSAAGAGDAQGMMGGGGMMPPQ